MPTEKEMRGAQIHYDLGIQQQQSGDVHSAYSQFQKSLELDPNFAEAHNALGILLHIAFGRPQEAIAQYQSAIAIRPTFSEAKTNLANVYLDEARYDEAILLYREVLNDMLYPTPYIAQGNLGWAIYKKSGGQKDQVKQAIQHIKSAVITNPKFCLGYKNLGTIEGEQGEVAESCKSFAKYREACPDVADAYYREGVCLARMGDKTSARQRFADCQSKAHDDALQESCRTLGERLQ
jgi:type IV pilus assembly protein PilF